MIRFRRYAAVATLSLALAGAAIAASHVDPAVAEAIKTRQAHMKAYGAQLQILGGMAQDKVAYDATAAAAAAATLASLAATDQSAFWPQGSDTSVEGSKALPAIWENIDDVIAKAGALQAATATLATAAGTDLDSLKAAFGPVGGACGACHQSYRQPNS